MQRRDKAAGKAVKARRRKTLKRRNAPKACAPKCSNISKSRVSSVGELNATV
jgi:hypothetical protein